MEEKSALYINMETGIITEDFDLWVKQKKQSVYSIKRMREEDLKFEGYKIDAAKKELQRALDRKKEIIAQYKARLDYVRKGTTEEFKAEFERGKQRLIELYKERKDEIKKGFATTSEGW